MARSSFKDLLHQLIDTLYPHRCAHCGQHSGWLCTGCLQTLAWVNENICDRCGDSVRAGNTICNRCRNNPLPLRKVRASLWYEGAIESAIGRLKYKEGFGLGRPLGQLLADQWAQWKMPVDLIVPVPLHADRLKKRTYNQAELLANELGRRIDIEVESGALFRIRSTRTQVGLNLSQRKRNLAGAFAVEGSIVQGRHVLLVDDVCTTGSTLAESAETLLANGALSVNAYCLARARSTKYRTIPKV